MAIVPKTGPVGSASTNPPVRRRIRAISEIERDKRIATARAAQETTVAEDPPVQPDEPPSASNRREDGSYIVGKGRTPEHTRWRKGQSGNPRGKKKGTPNTDTIIIDLMESPITVKTAGGEKKMTRKAALFQRMWEMAAKGDLKAARFLFDRYGEAQGRRANKAIEEEALSDVERGELESFMAAMRLGTDERGSEAQP